MNIKQLEYFVEVANTLNFTKASQLLYVSQSAITKQILALEQELGIELFIRNNKSVQLTTAGEIFLKDALGILYKVESTQDKMRDYQEGKSGHLNLGYVNGLERTPMLSALYHFYQKYPKCTLTYDSDISYQLRKKLLNDQMDLILTHRYIDDLAYENIAIFEFQMMVYVSKDSSYIHKDCFMETELDSLNQIYDRQRYFHDHMQIMEMDHSLLQVIGNKGVAFLPKFALEYTQFKDYLVGIPVKGKKEIIYAVYKKDNQNPLIQKLLTELKEVSYKK